MKKDIEGYFCKSNLKNNNIFYKTFRSLQKKKFPFLTKAQKINYYFIRKKAEANSPQFTTPRQENKKNLQAQFNSLKNMKDKVNSSFKIKIKLKLKKEFKSPINNRTTSLNKQFKFFVDPSTSYFLDTENSSVINFFNDYEKDFFTEPIYANLNYNEHEIYKSRTEYEELIKQKIEELKVKDPDNYKIKFEKKFHYGKYNKEINLTLDSLQISFKEMSIAPGPKDNFKINFPFSLLPIFYHKGIETFMKFLSSVIKIENNFEKVIFDKKQVMAALNKLKDFNIINEDLNDSDDIGEYENIFKKKLKKDKSVDLKPPILQKNNDFLKFNNFIFFWITNSRTFIITVTLPCISLNIPENKIMINHFIDYELLFYLYKINFANWEFYIINYLSSYSTFRNIFQQIDSLSKMHDKKIYLKEPKTMVNTFAQEKLVNIYTDQFGNNQIILFKSFYIKTTLIDIIYSQSKEFNIYFNFFHYVKLYEIAKYSSKILFLAKFIQLNKNMHTLNFNFTAYDEFNIKNWMANVRKFSDESLNNNSQNDELYREFDVFPKKVKIEFIRPKWSIIKLEDKNEIVKSWDIGNELEKELVNSIVDSGSDSWTILLNECLKKLNEPVPILPDIHSKKKIKKKMSIKRSFTLKSESEKKIAKRISKFYK